MNEITRIRERVDPDHPVISHQGAEVLGLGANYWLRMTGYG